MPMCPPLRCCKTTFIRSCPFQERLPSRTLLSSSLLGPSTVPTYRQETESGEGPACTGGLPTPPGRAKSRFWPGKEPSTCPEAGHRQLPRERGCHDELRASLAARRGAGRRGRLYHGAAMEPSRQPWGERLCQEEGQERSPERQETHLRDPQGRPRTPSPGQRPRAAQSHV